jgi:hypothetical protein
MAINTNRFPGCRCYITLIHPTNREQASDKQGFKELVFHSELVTSFRYERRKSGTPYVQVTHPQLSTNGDVAQKTV